MVKPPLEFPDRCHDCDAPVSKKMIYVNEMVNEGRKKYYVLVGLLCGPCADKRKELY